MLAQKLKIRINAIRKILKKLPRQIAENSFPSLLILFFLAAVLGGALFYKCYVVLQKIEPEAVEEPTQPEQKNLEQLLKTWQACQKQFEQAEQQEYPNPFNE